MDRSTLFESRGALALAVVAALFVVSRIRAAIQWRARTRGTPLPPGPKALPIVGNLFDVKLSAAGYREMAAQYGDIMYLRVLGTDLMILNTAEATLDLFEKRSANYSDRSKSTLEVMTGLEWLLGFMAYGTKWRQHRRLMWQQMNVTKIPYYQPSQKEEARKMIRWLYEDPAHLIDHIHVMVSGMLLKIVYGIDVDGLKNPNMRVVEAALDAMARGMQPGTYMAEYLPILDRIPGWLPFTNTQRMFAGWRKATAFLRENSYRQGQEVIANAKRDGKIPPTLVNTLLEDLSQSGLTGDAAREEEATIKRVCGTVIMAGVDTSESVLQIFFMAMSLYPEVQAKARAQLDLAVGPNRMPTWDDRSALVYVDAIIKEVLRWQNVVPLSQQHSPVEDDEYRGYFIPTGAVIVPNTWAIMHDPEMYPDPLTFNPDRWIKDGAINPDLLDPATIVFGFGRRICPGRHLADSSMFIAIAMILHVFDIGPQLDDSGKPIRFEPKMTPGFLQFPQKIHCTIKPHSAAAEALILSKD